MESTREEVIMEPCDPSLSDGVYTVVDEGGLQYATTTGARLIRILLVDTPVTEFVPGGYPPNGNYVPDKHEFKAIARTPKFVIFTPRSSAHAKQVEENQRQAQALDVMRGELDRLKKAHDEKDSEIEALRRKREYSDQALDEERKRARTDRERYAKLEQDIAKIRKALGDIEMKRVLET